MKKKLSRKEAMAYTTIAVLEKKVEEMKAVIRECGNPVRAQIDRLEHEAHISDHPQLYRDEANRLKPVLREIDRISKEH